MTEPRQVFVQVLKALTGQKCTPQQAQDILAERFCSGSAKNKTVVLLVDEVLSGPSYVKYTYVCQHMPF